MADQLVGRWASGEAGIILNLKADGTCALPGLTGWRRGDGEALEMLEGDKVVDTLHIAELTETSLVLNPGGIALTRTEQVSRSGLVGTWRFQAEAEDAVENVYVFQDDGKSKMIRDGEAHDLEWELDGEFIRLSADGEPNLELPVVNLEQQQLTVIIPEPFPGQPPTMTFERVQT